MYETVGNAINILNSSQCPYNFKKKRELLDLIYVDKYIDHSFFKCSNYDLLKIVLVMAYCISCSNAECIISVLLYIQ